MTVTAQDYVTSTTSVAAVGTTLGDVFGSMVMTASGTTLATTAKYLYVINKIRVCHNKIFSMFAAHHLVGGSEITRRAYIHPDSINGKV